MLLLVSPAKTLDFDEANYPKHDVPPFLEESQQLIDQLKTYSEEELQELMSISDKLAELNAERYQTFQTPFSTSNAKPAVLAFKGDVYKGINPDDFDDKDLNYAHEHLLILSGLYGVLRALDLMQPYRLEMKTKLPVGETKNLYGFWGNKITEKINAYLDNQASKFVINLASKEYFKAVKPKKLDGTLININFKEKRKGKLRTIAFYAKYARGLMCRYAIKNKLTDPEALKNFDLDDYTFNEELSDQHEWLFTR